ncbi:MAG TPA: DUF2512 family protein [Bacillota bacterium]|nr:DUF2512 family protein [Bacillota bacterium]
MNILAALLIKLGLQVAALGLLLPPARGGLLGAAFILWLVSFGLGDVLLLPLFGPLVAALGDGILAAGILTVLVGAWTPGVAVAALAIAVLEYFFHLALQSRDFVKRNIT